MSLKNALTFWKHLGRNQRGVVTAVLSGRIERPEIGFKRLLEIHDKDESAALATQFIAEAVVGPGHYTTADIAEAKRVVDRFAEEVKTYDYSGLDNYLFTVVDQIAAYGNSFTQKLTPEYLETLSILPIDSGWEIVRDRYAPGDVERIVQRKTLETVHFSPSQIIHWKWNIRNSRPFGRGILHYLAEGKEYTLQYDDGTSRTYRIPCLAEIKWMMENDERLVYHHLVPKSIWVFKDAPDEDIKSIRNDLKKLEPGERLATNYESQIVSESVDPRGRFDSFLQDIDVKIIRATQSPILKLFTTPGFTEASSRVVEDQFNRKIMALQRYVKRIVEHEIYWPILIQSGFDPLKANVKLNWGTEKRPEITIRDIIDLAKLSAETGRDYITSEEVRSILIEFGWKLKQEEVPSTQISVKGDI